MEKNGLMVSVWGPVGWKYLHSVSYGYPVNPLEYDAKNGLPSGTTENNYKMFFTFAGKTLPCGLCRESYAKFITQNPIRAKSRDDLTLWLWEIHNMVNDKLGVTYTDNSFENVKKCYESFRANCPKGTEAKGCTEPVDKNSKKRCRVTIEPIVPLYMDCSLLKITIIFSLLALLYSKKFKLQ